MTGAARRTRTALALGLLALPLAACSGDDAATSTTSTALPTSTTGTSSTTAGGEPVDGTPLPEPLAELLDLYCLWPADSPMPTTIEEVLGATVDVAQSPGPSSPAPAIPVAERAPGLEILHAGALTGTCTEGAADPVPVTLIVGVLDGPTDRVEVTAATAPLDADPSSLAAADPTAPSGLESLGGWQHRLTLGDGGLVVVEDADGAPVDRAASAERRDQVFAYVAVIEDVDEPFTWWLQTAQRTGPDPTDAIEWRLATGSTG